MYINGINLFSPRVLNSLYTTCRHYRIYKGRKRVTVESGKQSRFMDRRQVPSTIIQGNLFTPESAGLRELSMLCYWIVNYDYADSTIMNRYIKCTIDNLSKLKIKSIALIFHSLSKYCNKFNRTTIGYPDNSNDTRDEDIELLRTTIKLIEESLPILPDLVIRGIPKDLGMISLSIINLYEIINKELDDDTSHLLKSIEILLQKISTELKYKLPHCNMEEYVGLLQGYSKLIYLNWCKHFINDLSNEISTLLLEKIDDTNDLLNNIYIGQDLVTLLLKLPKQLTTITCLMSKCGVNNTIFWERCNTILNLLIKLQDYNEEYNDMFDIQTLILLSTSMMKYIDITPLLYKINEKITTKDIYPIITCLYLSINHLNDVKLAQEFYNKLQQPFNITVLPSIYQTQFIKSISNASFIPEDIKTKFNLESVALKHE